MTAYEKGFARGKRLKRLERRGIIGAANNPYKTCCARDAWLTGFYASYYGKVYP